MDAFAQVRMECGIALHLEELLSRRLVYFVYAGELELVEPDPAASPGAHVHRDTLSCHGGHDV